MANKRKVFDIAPPDESRETVVATKPKSKKGNSFVKKLSGSSEKLRLANAPKMKVGGKAFWLPALTVLVIVLIGCASYFLIEPKAEVEIWPVKSSLSFEGEILVDVSSSNVADSIPGETIVHEEPFSQVFQSTGIKMKTTKAQGTIRVYNNFSADSQILVATTRFVSDDGKLFRTKKRVVIPGMHYEGGKLVEGELDVVVEAGEPGEEYNIGPSTFSIPGFSGTPRYTAFYGKSFEPMAGGMEANVLYVTKEDLNKAEEVLTEKALAGCTASLETLLPSEAYIIIKDAFESEIVETNVLTEEGQVADSFAVQVKAKAKAIIFRQQDLENFVRDDILTQIPEGKRFYERSLAISYLSKDIDMKREQVLLDVEASAEIYPDINENSVKSTIKNQRPDEMKMSLDKFSEIDRFQVRLWPFWVNTVPLDSERINIKLRLD